jgi:hypothetical protein
MNIMTGTQSQIEWAERIKPQVDAEFSRVAQAFRNVARHQTPARRADTLAVIGILEEKRIEELAHDEAGYYIKHWQELNDQVRLMINQDPRYQKLKAKRG